MYDGNYTPSTVTTLSTVIIIPIHSGSDAPRRLLAVYACAGAVMFKITKCGHLPFLAKGIHVPLPQTSVYATRVPLGIGLRL